MANQLTETDLLEAIAAPSGTAPQLAPSKPRLRPYQRVKWVVDPIVAAALLVVSLPVMVVIAAAIGIDSVGPVFFRQQRIGLRGRPFTIYKFRTMFISAPAYSYKVSISDARITRVGRWLRRSGLDELPQLLNVLRGEMSLIGPRPELPFIVEQFKPGQSIRHDVKPGITGWWQVHHRNDVPLHLNLDHDIYYLKNMSFKLDFFIAWRTARIIASGILRHK